MSCYVGENQLGSVQSYQTRLFQSYNNKTQKITEKVKVVVDKEIKSTTERARKRAPYGILYSNIKTKIT